MFFIDVQGTLLSDVDKYPIDGAKELINYLNKNKTPYIIVTNNTKKLNFLDELRSKGLEILDDHYIDPFFVLRQIIPPTDVAMYGADEFIVSMQELGYRQNLTSPNAVLIASGVDFKFIDFAQMIEFLQNGAKLIPMHLTSIYHKNNYFYPGVGAIIKLLEFASGVLPYAVVGKPSKEFFTKSLELLKKQNPNAKFQDITIISDDYNGDIMGAKELGMQSALVLSGKIKKVDDKILVDEIYTDVKEFLCKKLMS